MVQIELTKEETVTLRNLVLRTAEDAKRERDTLEQTMNDHYGTLHPQIAAAIDERLLFLGCIAGKISRAYQEYMKEKVDEDHS